MQLFRSIRLYTTFYKSFLVFSMLINIVAVVLFSEHGINIFAFLFWLKIASIAVTYYFINSYKNKEYYYYYNAGISKFSLWFVSNKVDIGIFILLIIIAYQYR